jgi:hypothetical protein
MATGFTFTISQAEAEQIARRAAERGYTSPEAYLVALVDADALVHALREDWQDADDDAAQLEAEFLQSFHDAMTGNTRPISDLKG